MNMGHIYQPWGVEQWCSSVTIRSRAHGSGRIGLKGFICLWRIRGLRFKLLLGLRSCTDFYRVLRWRNVSGCLPIVKMVIIEMTEPSTEHAPFSPFIMIGLCVRHLCRIFCVTKGPGRFLGLCGVVDVVLRRAIRVWGGRGCISRRESRKFALPDDWGNGFVLEGLNKAV